jgi:predicted RNase H-like nuclease (RuvC/YqgF family)
LDLLDANKKLQQAGQQQQNNVAKPDEAQKRQIEQQIKQMEERHKQLESQAKSIESERKAMEGLFLRNQNSKYQQKQALNFNFRKAIEAKRKDIEEKEKKLAEFDQQLKKRKEQMDQLEKSLQKVSTKTYF